MTEFGNSNLKASHSMSFTGYVIKSMNQKYRQSELKIVVMTTKRNKKSSKKILFFFATFPNQFAAPTEE